MKFEDIRQNWVKPSCVSNMPQTISRKRLSNHFTGISKKPYNFQTTKDRKDHL